MCRGILPSLVAHKARMFEAATDSEGVEPHALDELLSNWTTATHTRGAPFPKFLYTTPTGANPSGTSASDERKRAVLGVIRKHNLLLLEDDPYYFLSFAGLSADADPVTRARGKSYFRLELEDGNDVGRVLRFDSFSKILSAGLRLGFITGPRELLDAIDLDTSSRNLQTSGTSQAIAYALLSKWGIDGFLHHADSVARFYQVRNLPLTLPFTFPFADQVSSSAGCRIDWNDSRHRRTAFCVRLPRLPTGCVRRQACSSGSVSSFRPLAKALPRAIRTI